MMRQAVSLTELEKKSLERFLKSIQEKMGPDFLRAVLFGSRARGEGDEDSDVDVLVLLKEVTLEKKHRIWDLATDIFLDTAVEISPLVMSEARFKQLQNMERLLPREIEREGIAL